jgi:hypothetical protein
MAEFHISKGKIIFIWGEGMLHLLLKQGSDIKILMTLLLLQVCNALEIIFYVLKK